MNEIWVCVKDFPDYLVSNLGRIKSIKKGVERVLKPSIDCRNDGYLLVCLYNKQGKSKVSTHVLARLILDSFEPQNTYKKYFVKYIDGDRGNIKLNNLKRVGVKSRPDKHPWNGAGRITNVIGSEKLKIDINELDTWLISSEALLKKAKSSKTLLPFYSRFNG
jgi:hypothetical protein